MCGLNETVLLSIQNKCLNFKMENIDSFRLKNYAYLDKYKVRSPDKSA